ncbi:MAG TPA: exodeoxyribonuclease VII large subunit, partial [Candidatus Sulfotelmatobacter sp.]|nr:exodeoxyribonuclease VII large subunit [Candidatus Sulfotelmatobacter sp.]
ALARHIYSVSALTAEVKAVLEDGFSAIWVEGELSNFKHHTSGHMYFTLKDPRAQLRAVMFRSSNRILKFLPKDGLSVLVFGTLGVYEPRGDYQITVEYMEPKGVGALQLAFEQLKARLEAEGLFDPARKRPLPKLPRKLGIVTSPTGAVIQDMLSILARRFPGLAVLVHPVPVQGKGSATEIAAAIARMGRRPDLDVLIVARGGGSLEDLWAFNEEVVARAIAACPIPVISAVGHETDVTIADFVADLRAPTPSAAAELAAAQREELCQRLDELGARAQAAIGNLLTARRRHLEMLARHLALLSPAVRVAHQGERLAALRRRLTTWWEMERRRRQERLALLAGKLHSLSPLGILGRGYSICFALPDRRILKAAAEAPVGTAVAVRLSEGELECLVRQVRNGTPARD